MRAILFYVAQDSLIAHSNERDFKVLYDRVQFPDAKKPHLIGERWVRAQEVEAFDLVDALSRTTTLPGETFLNSVPR